MQENYFFPLQNLNENFFSPHFMCTIHTFNRKKAVWRWTKFCVINLYLMSIAQLFERRKFCLYVSSIWEFLSLSSQSFNKYQKMMAFYLPFYNLINLNFLNHFCWEKCASNERWGFACKFLIIAFIGKLRTSSYDLENFTSFN